MKFYFKQHSDINCINRMTESSHLKTTYPDSVCFQAHTYSLYKVYVRKLGIPERVIAFFECLAKIVLSLGKSLSNADFQEKWTSVLEGRSISVIYLLNTQTSGPSVNETEQIEDHLSEKISKKDPMPSSLIDLSELFNRLPLEEGLNPSLLTSGECKLFAQFVQKWSNRTFSDKASWTADELADLLSIRKADCQNLLCRLQLFTGPHLPLNSLALTWVFTSIDEAITNKPRASMQWGVKMIWKPRTIVAGIENRFPKGIDFSSWTIDNLSMFLAVQKNALKNFLAKNNVHPNFEGEYISKEIDDALLNASNSDINTFLERNRTQSKSLRFAAN